jgi:hypothetical protein
VRVVARLRAWQASPASGDLGVEVTEVAPLLVACTHAAGRGGDGDAPAACAACGAGGVGARAGSPVDERALGPPLAALSGVALSGTCRNIVTGTLPVCSDDVVPAGDADEAPAQLSAPPARHREAAVCTPHVEPSLRHHETTTPGQQQPWWASVPRAEWPAGLGEAIAPLWRDPHGDRQIELVVIAEAAEAAEARCWARAATWRARRMPAVTPSSSDASSSSASSSSSSSLSSPSSPCTMS